MASLIRKRESITHWEMHRSTTQFYSIYSRNVQVIIYFFVRFIQVLRDFQINVFYKIKKGFNNSNNAWFMHDFSWKTVLKKEELL